MKLLQINANTKRIAKIYWKFTNPSFPRHITKMLLTLLSTFNPIKPFLTENYLNKQRRETSRTHTELHIRSQFERKKTHCYPNINHYDANRTAIAREKTTTTLLRTSVISRNYRYEQERKLLHRNLS